ncbi:MAG: CAP domain-containing protein [Lachnospiraceae bacterium]|nr:CAP domain-containing protein [Lachnospiraceae bacterium]
MKKKSLIGIIAGVVLVPAIACTILMNYKGVGIEDNSAKRDFAEIENEKVASIDDDAIALAASSASDTGLRNIALEALDQINAERAAAGLGSLRWDGNLESCSDVRAQECSVSFSHTRPSGKPWYTVNSRVQGGENLAYGFNSADAAVTAWMNSPTHRENILWPEFTRCAIAIYEADDGTMYWAQEFGY